MVTPIGGDVLMRILLINAEQDERLFATFKHEHILYD